MAKIVITIPNGQQIIHSSDGKDQALPQSAGKTVVITTAATGKVTSVHGQAPSTSSIIDNPA
jgi:hypothetical protein